MLIQPLLIVSRRQLSKGISIIRTDNQSFQIGSNWVESLLYDIKYSQFNMVQPHLVDVPTMEVESYRIQLIRYDQITIG